MIKINLVVFSLMFLLSGVSLSFEFTCKNKTNGKPLDMVTLYSSGGYDATQSMKNTLGDRIYDEYLKFTDLAIKKLPVFGMALKSLSRFRWVPLYKFNCSPNSKSEFSSMGFEQDIIYFSEFGFTSYYVNSDLNKSTFDSVGEYKDKKRILAIINEVLRKEVFGTGKSINASLVSNLFYELISSDLISAQFKEKQRQIMTFMDNKKKLMSFTREELVLLRELAPNLKVVMEAIKIYRKELNDKFVNVCKNEKRFNDRVDDQWLSLEIFHENIRNEGKVFCRYIDSNDSIVYKTILFKDEQVEEFLNRLRITINNIYFKYVPSRYLENEGCTQDGKSFCTAYDDIENIAQSFPQMLTPKSNRHRYYDEFPIIRSFYLNEDSFNEVYSIFINSINEIQNDFDDFLKITEYKN